MNLKYCRQQLSCSHLPDKSEKSTAIILKTTNKEVIVERVGQLNRVWIQNGDPKSTAIYHGPAMSSLLLYVAQTMAALLTLAADKQVPVKCSSLYSK